MNRYYYQIGRDPKCVAYVVGGTREEADRTALRLYGPGNFKLSYAVIPPRKQQAGV